MILNLITVLLLAVLVTIGSLFLLAKAKKEALGRTYTIAAYIGGIFGTLVFVHGITAAILFGCMHLHHGGHDRGGYKHGGCNMKMKHHRMMKMHGGENCCGSEMCRKMKMESCCEMGHEGKERMRKVIIQKGDSIDVNVEVVK